MSRATTDGRKDRLCPHRLRESCARSFCCGPRRPPPGFWLPKSTPSGPQPSLPLLIRCVGPVLVIRASPDKGVRRRQRPTYVWCDQVVLTDQKPKSVFAEGPFSGDAQIYGAAKTDLGFGAKHVALKSHMCQLCLDVSRSLPKVPVRGFPKELSDMPQGALGPGGGSRE